MITVTDKYTKVYPKTEIKTPAKSGNKVEAMFPAPDIPA